MNKIIECQHDSQSLHKQVKDFTSLSESFNQANPCLVTISNRIEPNSATIPSKKVSVSSDLSCQGLLVNSVRESRKELGIREGMDGKSKVAEIPVVDKNVDNKQIAGRGMVMSSLDADKAEIKDAAQSREAEGC